MNKKVTIASLIIITFFALSIVGENKPFISEYIFELEFKISGGGIFLDYGRYIAQDLSKIGIKINVQTEEWIVFVGTITVTYDFDLAFLGLTGSRDPDATGIYNENGSLNMFGINTDIPYGDENEEMIAEGVTIFDLEERQQHYYDWQQLLMDKILPMLPFFSPRSYVSNWATLDGYDNRWGIAASLPYMEFTSLHEGQGSTEEFNVHDAKWTELNPLLQNDSPSSHISSLLMEPLIQMTPGFEPIKTGLIVDWEQDKTNENLYKFTMRDGVYWNPSFNVTERDASSDPLVNENGEIVDESLLMVADDGAYSDGTNQQVTAKDAVFTLLAWANPIISSDADTYEWIHKIWVDPTDPLSFYIEIDGDPTTPEKENYAPFWSTMTPRLLPEFFLNTTSTTVTYSSGGVPMIGIEEGIRETPQWETYSTSAFGCGKYMLDYYVEDSVTVLQASPFWMGIGAIDGTEQDLDIKTVNIRVIPNIYSALAEFKAGKLDIMGMTSFPDERREMEIDPIFEVQSQLQNSLSFMAYNLRRPFIGGADNYAFLTEPGYEEYTKALAVRKAIAYAIDREEINNVLHDGEYLISHSVIYPIQAYWYYNDIIKYNHDIELARQWIERADFQQSDLTGAETTTNGKTESIPYSFGFLTTFFAIVLIPTYIKTRRRQI